MTILNDTIAAIATAPGSGGIGVIRISGSSATKIAEAICGKLPAPRYASLHPFKDHQGQFLDQGLVLYFPAPNSFTGEDVIELQGHGGSVILDMLLETCLQLGARVARPGEFSERAFLNGRMDLTQAEAVADMIDGSSRLAVKLAGRSLRGAFSQHITELLKDLIQIRVEVEAALDFSDEDIDLTGADHAAEMIDAVLHQLDTLLATVRVGQKIREGMLIVLCGGVNVGKSSLLNRLAGSEEAIVTAIAGTTRDLLKVDIDCDGLPIRLVDTAGLRDSDDPVEQEGIRRARVQVAQADLVLLLDDTNNPDSAQPRPDFLPTDVPLVYVHNKIDLNGISATAQEQEGVMHFWISATTGAGVTALTSYFHQLSGTTQLPEGAFIARRRHLDALQRTRQSLLNALDCARAQSGLELIAEELRQAQQALDEITGKFSTEDLLGEIFAGFCVGK